MTFGNLKRCITKEQFIDQRYDGDYLRLVMKFHDSTVVRSNDAGHTANYKTAPN